MEKELQMFDEEFIPDNIGRFAKDIDVDGLGIPMIPRDVKHFLIKSHNRLLTSLIEEMEGEKVKTLDMNDDLQMQFTISYNDAIYDQISKLKERLEANLELLEH